MRSAKICQTALKLRGSRQLFTNGRFVANSAKQQIEVKTTNEVSKSDQRSEVTLKDEGAVQKRPSFVKELFLGNFDTTVLTYPEVLDKDRLETLHEMLKPIERFYEEKR